MRKTERLHRGQGKAGKELKEKNECRKWFESDPSERQERGKSRGNDALYDLL